MKSVRCDSKRRVIATLAAIGLSFAVVSTTPAVAPAAPVATDACETTVAKVKVSKTGQGANSTTYVDVIDTTIVFTQGRTDCVIVSFSSEAFAAANTAMQVRAVVDGKLCEPDHPTFVSSGASTLPLAVRAMNFLCLNVAPGNHTVKMQFNSSSSSGATVSLWDRTMIVHYAK